MTDKTSKTPFPKSIFARASRAVRKIFGVPENLDQIVLAEKIIQRAYLVRKRAAHIRTITDKLEATLRLNENKYWPLTEREMSDVQKRLADLKSTSKTQENLVGRT